MTKPRKASSEQSKAAPVSAMPQSANLFLEQVMAEVVLRATRKPGASSGVLLPFARLMSEPGKKVLSKQAIAHWISSGGIPRSHRDQLHKVLSSVWFTMTNDDFERLLQPVRESYVGPRCNAALIAVINEVRACNLTQHELSKRLGMSYWQLYRAANQNGGLTDEQVARLGDALRVMHVRVDPALIAACGQPGEAARLQDRKKESRGDAKPRQRVVQRAARTRVAA